MARDLEIAYTIRFARLGMALGRQRVYPLAFTSTMLLSRAFVKKIGELLLLINKFAFCG